MPAAFLLQTFLNEIAVPVSELKSVESSTRARESEFARIDEQCTRQTARRCGFRLGKPGRLGGVASNGPRRVGKSNSGTIPTKAHGTTRGRFRFLTRPIVICLLAPICRATVDIGSPILIFSRGLLLIGWHRKQSSEQLSISFCAQWPGSHALNEARESLPRTIAARP